MRRQVAVFAVIFPGNLPYFSAFLQSLKQQTYQDFELVLIQDDVTDAHVYIERAQLEQPVHIFDMKGSIAHIRMEGIAKLKSLGYKYVLFADSDDVVGTFRLEKVLKTLSDVPLVSTDFSLIDSTGRNILDNYWSNRMPDGCLFDRSKIMDFNFAGLGNTACSGELLREVELPDELIAVDWYLFYSLLGVNDRGAFIHRGDYFYRQYAENTAGVGSVDGKRLKRVAEVREIHFRHMAKTYPHLESKWHQALQVIRDLQDDSFVDVAVGRVRNRNQRYFWWEETEYIYI